MTTKTYRGWTIKVVGISHYIYAPGQSKADYARVEQSMAAAKRYIQEVESHLVFLRQCVSK